MNRMYTLINLNGVWFVSHTYTFHMHTVVFIGAIGAVGAFGII